MKCVIDQSEQGSPEWLKARIGFVTSSEVHKVMAGGKGVTRHNYMTKMLCEVLSGQPVLGFQNGYMQDGQEREPIARRAYEFITENKVNQLGFAYLPEEKLGASTDGEVDGQPGLIEIKNVIAPEQVRLLSGGKIKSEHIKQMQTNMYVLDKQWCDFVSQSLGDEIYGELPDRHKYKIIRVERDEKMIDEIRKAVKSFHQDLATLLEQMR